LRSGLHGLAPLLGEIVLEPFFLSRRLTELLELSLKVDDPLLLLRCILQQVGPALGTFRLGLSHNNKVVSHISSTRHQKIVTRRSQLTVSAVLMVIMLVRKACISLLSSNQPSCQGV
jgi:hypothetical protein